MSEEIQNIVQSSDEAEVLAIREEIRTLEQGVRAFVRLGIRLLIVRQRTEHGCFIPWLEKNVPELKKRQLYNAMRVSKHLLALAELEITPQMCNAGAHLEIPLEPIFELIEGQSVRGLITMVREDRADEAEQKAKAQCEDLFAENAALRDEWEPRILGGEITYCQAIRGIWGQQWTAKKKRGEANYGRLIPSALKTLQNGASRWDTLPDETRSATVAGIKTIAGHLPDEALALAGLKRA